MNPPSLLRSFMCHDRYIHAQSIGACLCMNESMRTWPFMNKQFKLYQLVHHTNDDELMIYLISTHTIAKCIAPSTKEWGTSMVDGRCSSWLHGNRAMVASSFFYLKEGRILEYEERTLSNSFISFQKLMNHFWREKYCFTWIFPTDDGQRISYFVASVLTFRRLCVGREVRKSPFVIIGHYIFNRNNCDVHHGLARKFAKRSFLADMFVPSIGRDGHRFLRS